MAITKQMVADRIAAYLRHQLTPAELVDWAGLPGERAFVFPAQAGTHRIRVSTPVLPTDSPSR